jgi:hypothetical protein
MNPNDLLLLTIPAALAALKFGLIAFAVVMLARGIFRPQVKLVPRPIAPSHAPQGSRGSRV